MTSAMQRGCPGQMTPLDHLYHGASMRCRSGGRLASDFRLRVDPRHSTAGSLSAVRQAPAYSLQTQAARYSVWPSWRPPSLGGQRVNTSRPIVACCCGVSKESFVEKTRNHLSYSVRQDSSGPPIRRSQMVADLVTRSTSGASIFLRDLLHPIFHAWHSPSSHRSRAADP